MAILGCVCTHTKAKETKTFKKHFYNTFNQFGWHENNIRKLENKTIFIEENYYFKLQQQIKLRNAKKLIFSSAQKIGILQKL